MQSCDPIVHLCVTAVGGLTSPVRGAYQEPLGARSVERHAVRSRTIPSCPSTPSLDPPPEGGQEQRLLWVSPWRENAHDEEYEEEEEYEENEESGDEEEDDTEWETSFPERLHPRSACHSRTEKLEQVDSASSGSEQELKKLSRGTPLLDFVADPSL